MSDRVTNAEVEDVLSSIRRLVSDDNRPGQAGKTGPQSRRPVTERLMLTPALRVTDPVVEPQTDVESTAENAADKAPLDLDPDQRVAAPSDQTREQSPDALAEDYSSDPYGFDDTEETADQPDEDEIVSVKAETVTQEAQVSPEQTAPDVKAAALNAKIAALETAIGKISDTWEPDDLGESDYAGTAPQEMTWEDDETEPKPFYRPTLAPVMRKVRDSEEAEDVSEPKHTDDTPVQDAEPAAQEFFTTRKTPPKTFEAEVADIEPEPVPDVEEPPVQQAEPIVEPDVTAAAPSPQDVVLGEGDQLLDEDALREMIAEIVRAELQGALGERITRNVRKLVRREIHRALTAQELE